MSEHVGQGKQHVLRDIHATLTNALAILSSESATEQLLAAGLHFVESRSEPGEMLDHRVNVSEHCADHCAIIAA
jgi:hypothetical protein